MSAPRRSVIVAGQSSELSARIQVLLNYDGSAVRRVTRPEELSRARWSVSRPSRAVLCARLPSGGGRELRAFRRELAAQAFGLSRGVTQRASILVVAEQPAELGASLPGHRLESMLSRMRASAQQELASTVKVNALVASGRVDGPTVAFRVWEAMQGRALPDSDFVVYDDDIRGMSIAALITEARS